MVARWFCCCIPHVVALLENFPCTIHVPSTGRNSATKADASEDDGTASEDDDFTRTYQESNKDGVPSHSRDWLIVLLDLKKKTKG